MGKAHLAQQPSKFYLCSYYLTLVNLAIGLCYSRVKYTSK